MRWWIRATLRRWAAGNADWRDDWNDRLSSHIDAVQKLPLPLSPLPHGGEEGRGTLPPSAAPPRYPFALSPSFLAFCSSSVGGGSLPYLARYWAANFSLCSGWQMKHCESGRSCSLHQSPFFLYSAATLELHRAQSCSGTPCSAHHQSLWSSCFLAT